MNIYVLESWGDNKNNHFDYNINYVSQDVFLSSLMTESDVELFIWRYAYPWNYCLDFDEKDLEDWNSKQTLILNALKRSKKKIIIINEDVNSLSSFLRELYGNTQLSVVQNNELPTNSIKNKIYINLIATWGKKYWSTLQRLESISFKTPIQYEERAVISNAKNGGSLPLWLSFISNSFKINIEHDELNHSLKQRYNELAKLTLLLESNRESYNSELKSLNANNEELKSKKEKLEVEFSDYKNKNDVFSNVLIDKDKDILELKKELISEKNKNQESHNKIKNISDELSVCKQSLNSRFKELAVITSMLEESKRETIKTSEMLELIKIKNASLKSSLSCKMASSIRSLRKSLSFKSKRKDKIKELSKVIKLIGDSKLFDKQWYLNEYPDVKDAGIEPIRHYLLCGGFESRDPSAGFSSQGYLDLYPDVKESGLNPLEHYIRYGSIEKRTIVTK